MQNEFNSRGCWFFYQVGRTTQILGSSVATNVLNLEKPQAQYIYIDHPRYKDIFMFREESKDPSTSTMEKINGHRYKITKWWKSLNRNIAYKLLSMAKNGDWDTRTKAVRTLCSMKHLKDWDYRQMAQMLDAKTAVALARVPETDLRFFLKPPYYHTKHKLYDLIEYLHLLMNKMDAMCESTHPCLVQFLNKKFRDTYREGLGFDHDLSSVGLAVTPAIIWNHELLKNCIATIHHHSSLEQCGKDIADVGGLPILIDVQKIFANNMEICILLAKIISNLSLHCEYLEDIFRSGWIGILAAWSRHPDVRLSAPASRALANLDTDENPNEKYPRRVYLLHPQHRVTNSPKLDVIFIHGLLGGVFVTWRQRDLEASSSRFVETPTAYFTSDTLHAVIGDHPQEFLKDLARDLKQREWKRIGHDYEVVLDDCPENMNARATGPFTCRGDAECMEQAEYDNTHRTQCWPRDWLPKDVSSLRVLGINYDTNLSMWNPACPFETMRATLDERSDEFAKKLPLSGVGKRPVVWVCHSMGGLLVKKMLVKEWKNGDKNGLCKNTKAIIFYSTPHRGSHVAALKHTTQMVVWPSVEVQELRQESPALMELHEDFLNMLKSYAIDIVSFSETKSTLVTALKFPFQFVTPYSADPGVGEFFEIPQNHLTICKPANRQSFLYRKVLSIVRRHVPTENSARSKKLLAKLLSWTE
ncbi:protein SERAC1 isoform X2 [Venturia canescens]|uniref:protein SERAC1 isoform X2 n=1 Tax=Venturia canescens TaxID=32260 RepID=UPI001C9C9AC2|nr:protein SERAC1 isoform X2 [Venturia canescens]